MLRTFGASGAIGGRGTVASITDNGDYYPVALPQKQVMAAVEGILQQLAPGQVKLASNYTRATLNIELAEKVKGNVFIDVDPPVGSSGDSACRVRVLANVSGEGVQTNQVEEAHRFTRIFHAAVDSVVNDLLSQQREASNPADADRELD